MTKPTQYHYGEFPPKQLNWEELIPSIGPASAALARYDGTLSAVPSPDVLLSPLTTQEAVLSSKIEGTQATIGEVLEYEARGDMKDLPSERTADINEVLNYRIATRHATSLLDKLPLCERVVREAHRVLLQGVRGESKSPGDYRKIPNWIGPKGSPIDKARFIPISPDRIAESMKRWEKYYERLLAVSKAGAWTGWCSFFLDAVTTQAKANQEKASKILNLYEHKKQQVRELTHSQYAMHALDFIFKRPIFKSTDFVRNAEIPEPTAKRIMVCFRKASIVKTLREGQGRRPAFYMFSELLRIADE